MGGGKGGWLGKDGEGERQPGVPQDLTENLNVEDKTNRGETDKKKG